MFTWKSEGIHGYNITVTYAVKVVISQKLRKTMI